MPIHLKDMKGTADRAGDWLSEDFFGRRIKPRQTDILCEDAERVSSSQFWQLSPLIGFFTYDLSKKDNPQTIKVELRVIIYEASKC